jgi:hypothetical protein
MEVKGSSDEEYLGGSDAILKEGDAIKCWEHEVVVPIVCQLNSLI